MKQGFSIYEVFMYPFISIFGRQIGSYGICMLVAVLLVGWLSVLRGRRFGVSFEDVAIVGATSIGFALVCGSLLYTCVTFPMDVILDRLKAADLSFFFSGGIVFFGGLLGAIPGALLGSRIAGCKIRDLEHTIVPFIPLGHGIGRIGCLLGGCCYGKPYCGPLAVRYPNSLLGLPPEQTYFPVQLLETAINMVICGLLLRRAKYVHRRFDLLFDYLAFYSVSRFVLEWFRGDQHRGIWGIFSVSQWISLGLFILYLGRFFIMRKVQRKNAPQ